MATVIITRTDGSTETITGVPDADTARYDRMPFDDPNVLSTEIRP